MSSFHFLLQEAVTTSNPCQTWSDVWYKNDSYVGPRLQRPDARVGSGLDPVPQRWTSSHLLLQSIGHLPMWQPGGCRSKEHEEDMIYIYTRYIYDIDIIVIYTYRFYRTHLQELCGNLDLYETGVIDFLELNGCNCFLLNGLNLVETSCCQPPLDLCQHVTRNNPEFTIYIYTVSIQSLEES